MLIIMELIQTDLPEPVAPAMSIWGILEISATHTPVSYTHLSYKITVTKGRDANGKQIRHFMTFSPAPNMTEKKAEKEAQRAAFAFEKQIEDGFSLDNRQTFSQYAAYVIDLKERAGAKHRTIERYRQLMERITPAIGHIKLADIKPQDVYKRQVYNQLV